MDFNPQVYKGEPAAEPVEATYEDNVEGKLQHMTDLSLYYGAMKKEAKTQFKRDFYQKKLVNNNRKLYRLLVRTPNAFNPLMELLKGNDTVTVNMESNPLPEDGVLSPFCQVVGDENAEPELVEYTITATGDTEQVWIDMKKDAE